LDLPASIQNVHIPGGKTEGEIWKIFDKTFHEMNEGDEVVLDITHAFRSIPLLANAVLNYAKVLKGISIAGIYYGAFEVLGNPAEVKRWSLDQRRVPIFDLTAFDVLHDWSIAIDRFLETGDAVSVSNLATKSVRPLLSASKGADRAALGIKRIAEYLRELSKAISTCRAPEISSIAAALKEEIASCEGFDLIPAFVPLLGRLRQKMVPFHGENDVADGIQAARWCLDHNLIQQGYTILNETLRTHCIGHFEMDPQDIRVREVVAAAAKPFKEDDEGGALHSLSEEQLDAFKRLKGFFLARPELAQIITNLSDIRNDLNHAGYRHSPMRAERFAPKLRLFLERTEQILG
jgi:CRISPR-associated DxTHG motif protein